MTAQPLADTSLIARIREEVRDVKGCFTNFSFQASTLAAVAFGFVCTVLTSQPWTAVAAAPVIIVLMMVCRIGIFKYTTANRNLGYELHLDRLRVYKRHADKAGVARIERLENIGWEEALRAWRVVQASIYATVHTVPQNRCDRLRLLRYIPLTAWIDPVVHREQPWHELREKAVKRGSDPDASDRDARVNDKPYKWWNQKELTIRGDGSSRVAHYHTGNYLKDMLRGLNTMQWTLYLCLFWPLTTFGVLENGGRRPIAEWPVVDRWSASGYLLCVLSFGVLIALRQWRIYNRRLILEDGLVSIHSSAITWTAVAIAHVFATNADERPYYHYTERLAAVAKHIYVLQLPIVVADHLFSGSPIFDMKSAMNEPALERRKGPRDRRVAVSGIVVPLTAERREGRADRRSEQSAPSGAAFA